MDAAWIGMIGVAVGAAAGVAGSGIHALADRGRQRRQHAEAERQHRQGVYHDFYDAVTQLNALLEETAPAIRSGELFSEDAEWSKTREALFAVLRQFRHTLNGVYLFGGDDVRMAAEGVVAANYGDADLDLVVAILRGQATMRRGDTRTALSVMIEPWELGLAEGDFWEPLEKLLSEMRKDVQWDA